MDKLMDRETLVKAAQNIVALFVHKEALESGKSPSAGEIADRAKMAETTIRSAKGGYLQNITYEKVVLLANNLLGVQAYDPQKIQNIAELDSNAEKETFLRRFSHLFNYSSVEGNLEKSLNSFEKMKVFCAAYSKSHISRDAIIEQMGASGEEAIKELTKLGLVKEENGIIKGSAKACIIPIQLVHKMAQMSVANFSFEKNKEERNWLSHQTESVNEQFIDYWRGRSKDFFEEFTKTSRLPQFEGHTQFSFLQSSDIYLEETNPTGGGVQ